jgi:hypothetical protein
MRSEFTKIKKFKEKSKVLFCKVTNKRAGHKPTTYDDNEDVSGVTWNYSSLWGEGWSELLKLVSWHLK